MSTDFASLSAEDRLLRVSIGDVSAFDTLYSVKMPVVRAAAMQLLRDRHHAEDVAQKVAEDVAQKVMVSIWQCAARFNPLLGSANAWILQITRHKAIDRIRTAILSTP
jgi:RNA polymerase sigma-70 factor (ECF subfamily)